MCGDRWLGPRGNQVQNVILENLEKYKNMETWRKPPELGSFKCNTDGASRGNPGPSSAAFYIRNHSGDLMYAGGRRLSDTTNLIVEAVAIKEGVKYCIDHLFLPLIVETDSLTMRMILDGIWEVPWSISLVVKRIQHLREGRQIQVIHFLREGNCLVDYFTNLVFDFAGTAMFGEKFTLFVTKYSSKYKARGMLIEDAYGQNLSYKRTASHST
ncbi:uncharacterized protein LOC132637707 [Lycium barbarum]|uniref:uncharacterized protein LOC132637707 n=1 Tax=Lycium barbarum TaxID=112863 RepID=UPI00293EB8A8|nr:uncharacterized protein LOC132637707 [Lycium barbarum]